MTSEELSALSKTHAEAILAHRLTKAEVVMLIALVQARLQASWYQPTSPAAAPVPADVAAKPLGNRIAEKGYPCVCIACSKHVYTVNKDIYDGTTVAEFIESFTPMPGYPKITKQTKISNIEGNITTQCPDCSGDLTLYLAGKRIDG
jgi:hypothetical protein